MGIAAKQLDEGIELYETLMDLQMPGLNGIDAIGRILGEFPAARIIVLTTYRGDAQVTSALRAGARAYLLQENVHLELLDIIYTAGSGKIGR